MRNGYSTVCDACFKPLDGIVGTAKVRKQYISIQGVISLKSYDKNKIEHYVYADGSRETAMMKWYNFCNGSCLDAFMQSQIVLKGLYHDQRGLAPVDYVDPGGELEEIRIRKHEDLKAKKEEVEMEPPPEKPPTPPEDPEPKPPIKTGFFNNFKY